MNDYRSRMKEYLSNLVKQEIISLGEETKRDYKAEYKKFQSSTKSKKYRAELNQYNRKKGTYGNGDGKDASHKGGKIVGFESQSKNRGRAEKSRLKKEVTLNENPVAIAATQGAIRAMKNVKVQGKSGNKISAVTALKDKTQPSHNRAKSVFSKLFKKFKKSKKQEPKKQSQSDIDFYKKQFTGESINEEMYFDPKSEFKKYMDKVFKQSKIKVIKFNRMKQSFHNGAWGGFYTVKSSNKVDIGGKPVKRGSAVLPVYISRKGEIELGIKAGGFHIGKAGSSQVVKNLKDFKKGDLEESYKTLTEGIRVRMGEIAKQGEWEVYNPQNGKSIKVVKSSGAATRLMNRLMNSGKYDEIGSRHVETHKNENKSVTEKKGVPGSVFTIDTAKKTTELMTKVLKKVSPDIQRGQIYHSALGGTDRVSIVGKFSLDRKKTWSRNILENSRFITFHLDNDGTLEVNVNGYPFSMRKQVQMRKTRNNDIKQVLSRMVTHFSMLNKKYPEGM